MKEQKDRLEHLAAKSVKLYPSDRERAAKHLANAIAKDETLRGEALYRVSRTLVDEMSRALHSVNMRRSMPALAQSIREQLGGILESWPLSGGIVLAKATRIDLDLQIHHLKATRHGIDVQIRFYESLKSRLSDDRQVVADVVTSEEAQALYEEAEAEQ